MEDHLKRELEPHEHVYHLNGDSKDNRIENLIIITKKSWNPNGKNQYSQGSLPTNSTGYNGN
jgi:hypothetical protein